MPIVVGAAAASARPTGPTYTAAKFGGRALPGTGALQAWVDMLNGGNWSLDDIQPGDSRPQLGIAGLAWRGRGAFMSQDFQGGREVVLPTLYKETTGSPLSNALATLSQAGEQYLTFDTATYLSVRYSGFASRVMRRKFNPLWWRGTLTFRAADPWVHDFQASGSLANRLNPYGGFELGSITGWASGTDSGVLTFAQSSTAHSGTKSASIAANPSGSGYWGTPIGTSGYAVNGGDTYTVDGWIQTTSVTGMGAYFRILEYDSTGVLVKDWGASLMTPVAGTVGWTEYATTFTLQANTAYLTVRCHLNATAGSALFDDVVLQKSFDATTGLYAAAFADQVALTGSVGAGTTTTFKITYAGSVWGEPLYRITIPATNAAAITSITIVNQTTGVGLTFNFSPALAASQAYTFDVDCAALTAVIGATQYDWTGPGGAKCAFPMLYPGANTIAVTIVTSSGTATATADYQVTNRWEA